MDKLRIVGTGLSGLVGSRIVELLQKKYTFIDLSLETGIDITKPKQVKQSLSVNSPDIVLHLAAKTDVDACEMEKARKNQSMAWKINVQGTETIAEFCQQKRLRLFYISSDFVFNGEKESYVEEDEPKPINFYGETKYQAEKRVRALGQLATVCRISFPYRAFFPFKTDLVRAIINRFKTNEPVLAISDQIIVPTFIDDIAGALDLLISQKKSGIYHLVGDESLSPLDLAHRICSVFGYNNLDIQPVKRDEYFRNRAYRPFKTILRNDKIRSLCGSLRSVSQGLLAVKNQQQEQGKL